MPGFCYAACLGHYTVFILVVASVHKLSCHAYAGWVMILISIRSSRRQLIRNI